jgi:dUTP pyrophosphatase
MQRVAKFYKVSFEQFQEGWTDTFGEPAEQSLYDNLKLPVRATAGSAGYDFFSPLTFSLARHL